MEKVTNKNETMYFLSDTQLVSNDTRLYTLQDLYQFIKDKVKDEVAYSEVEDYEEARLAHGLAVNEKVLKDEEQLMRWCDYFDYDVKTDSLMHFICDTYQNEEVRLKVWETEDDRDQGVVDDSIVQGLENAFQEVSLLDSFASVEISIPSNHDLLIYFEDNNGGEFNRDALQYDYRKDLGCFIDGIQIEDCDVVDKLVNLNDGGDLSKSVYDTLMNNEELQNQIAVAVIEWVKDTSKSVGSLQERMSDFEQWYDDKDLETLDYTSALYNCDEVYLDAIQQVIKEKEYTLEEDDIER